MKSLSYLQIYLPTQNECLSPSFEVLRDLSTKTNIMPTQDQIPWNTVFIIKQSNLFFEYGNSDARINPFIHRGTHICSKRNGWMDRSCLDMYFGGQRSTSGVSLCYRPPYSFGVGSLSETTAHQTIMPTNHWTPGSFCLCLPAPRLEIDTSMPWLLLRGWES